MAGVADLANDARDQRRALATLIGPTAAETENPSLLAEEPIPDPTMHAQAYLFEAWQRGHSHAQESGLDPESAAWVAEAGGRAVLNELLPRYQAVEEQERANWTYIRQLRAANERLRDTLTQIAALSLGPASDLAIAALEAAPATRSRADDEVVGDPAPLTHWATLTPRHRNGAWYLAAHVDRPNDQVVVRWASIPLDPDRPWEGSGGGLDYPADAFTHVIPRPQGPGQGETIELAAIQHRGLAWAVPRPGRHGDVVRCLADTHPDEGPFVGEQGFLTSTGRFVDRVNAGEIALKAGQTEALKWGRELFSEDLW